MSPIALEFFLFSLLNVVCPEYIAPEIVHNENLSIAFNPHRVGLYGKLLDARFTQDDHYCSKHARLWVSAVINPSTDLMLGDITPEITVSIFQVYFVSRRKSEWSESMLLPGQLLFMQDLLFGKGWYMLGTN